MSWTDEEKTNSEGSFKKFQSIGAKREFGGHLTIAYTLPCGFGIWKKLTLTFSHFLAAQLLASYLPFLGLSYFVGKMKTISTSLDFSEE